MNVGRTQKLIEICKEVFPKDAESIHEGSRAQDIASWDSMGHILLIQLIESTFEVTFDIEELMEFDSIPSIQKALSHHLPS